MVNITKGDTKILGVIGNPIEHSFSPQIHNTICKHLKLNYTYVPFNVKEKDLEYAVKGLSALSVEGFNVTIPHKNSIMKYLDKISDDALLIGAVNTVKNVDNKWYGYNTDGDGFIRSLSAYDVDVKGKKVVILGAGGAAKAVAVKIAMQGAASIIILNRTLDKAKEICSVINKNVADIASIDMLNAENIKIYGEIADIIIHTTPIGMYPNNEQTLVQQFDFIRKDTVVCDLIYNPAKTVLLKKAQQAGCKVINGWGMLIYQAVNAFEIWTGKKASHDVIALLTKQNTCTMESE